MDKPEDSGFDEIDEKRSLEEKDLLEDFKSLKSHLSEFRTMREQHSDPDKPETQALSELVAGIEKKQIPIYRIILWIILIAVTILAALLHFYPTLFQEFPIYL